MRILSGSSFVVKLAAGLLAALVAIAVFAPWISPHDPTVGSLRTALQGPSGEYWLGTDYLGRDVLSRLIAGSRVAMFAGLESVAVALAIGLPIGLTIGFLGGWPDRVGMRIIEGVSAIPGLVLAIGIIAAFGSGLTRSMFAVGVAFAMGVARLARGLVLAERERLYVDGARVIGASRLDLLTRHIAPNVAAPLIVLSTMIFASAITIEAGLSYLGLGVEPPTASWGAMLSAAQRTYREQPFQTVPPGVAILLTVLAINVVGDSLLRRRKGQAFSHPAGYLEPVVVARAESHAEPEPGAVLTVRGLNVSYGTNGSAVNDVDLDIGPGEFVALVGESGSGKTSVAMAVAGLLTPPAAVSAATISLRTDAGETIDLVGRRHREQRHWRDHIGVVFQEPSASLNPLQTIGRQLADVLEAVDTERSETETRSIELLADVGIPRPDEVLRLRPHQISGGMAQRVVIAMALARNPTVLIADEPTTALDVMVQADIITLLRELGELHGIAVLLVTHDLGVAAWLADRAMVMLNGRVVESGTIGELVERPQHEYTAELVRAVPRNQPGHRVGGAAPRTSSAPAVAVVEDLTVRFQRPRRITDLQPEPFTAVDSVSFALHPGTITGLVGQSGSGKSTVARAILRLTPFEGRITIGDVAVHDLALHPPRSVRRTVQAVFQDPLQALNPRHTVARIVGEPLRIHELARGDDIDTRIDELLDSVGLEPDLRHRTTRELSGGQRQRVAIARALATEPKVLVLDEALSALDVTTAARVARLLRELVDESTAMLFIGHDLAMVRQLCDDVLVMHEGRVVEHGSAEQVCGDPQHEYTRKLIASIPDPTDQPRRLQRTR